MNRSRATVVAVALAFGILLDRTLLRAEVAVPTAAQPVFFHGELSAGGGPITGERTIAVNIWKSADSTVATNRVCAGTPTKTAVVKGSFQVALSATCVDTLRLLSSAWYELVVDDVRFPLQAIGAVPFAVTPTQQPRSGSRLQLVHKSVEAEDGTYIPNASLEIVDTKVGQRCTWVNDRCLPGPLGQPLSSNLWEDAACTKAVSADAVYAPQSDPLTIGSYAIVAGGPVKITAEGPIYENAGGTCLPFYIPPYRWFRYTAVPATDFVAKKK